MKRFMLASFSASLVGVAGAALAAPPSQIDVMTQNQYLGADLNPVVAACSAVDPSVPGYPFDPASQACNAAILAALGQVAANLPEQRYVALAREISGRRPDVVGLQEVFDFQCAGPGCSYQAISGAFNDHLQGTLDALNGAYVTKGIVKDLDVTLPVMTPVGPAMITVVDHDVILVRSDLAGSSSAVAYNSPYVCGHPSMDGCNYEVVATTSLGGSTLRIERGFVGIDVTVRGKDYRVVNTHLEVRNPDGTDDSRIVQAAQAYQLKATVLPTLAGQTLIVVGDFNSAPGDTPVQTIYGLAVPPYMQFAMSLGAGDLPFTDAWTMRPGTATGRGAPLVGLSCCQDEDLDNRKSALYERIDLVWSLTKPSKVMDARLIGETPSSKTMPKGMGLWPSDHAAVAATLRY